MQPKYNINNSNLLQQVNPMGGEWTYKYDEEGNRLTEKDPLQRLQTYDYDAKGNLKTYVDAKGYETIWTYNPMDQVTNIRDAEDGETSYLYDALDRLISQRTPEGRETRYTYDAVGNRTSETNPLGRTTTYAYDTRNRVVTTTDAKDGSARFAYDSMGRLIEQNDPNGNSRTWSYNQNGQVVEETNGLGAKTLFTYDLADQLIEQTTPNGTKTAYTYTTLGQLATTKYDEETLAYAYDPVGRLTAASSPSTEENYTYNANGNLLSQHHAELEKAIHYTYDAVGNRLTVTNSEDRTTTYTYDERNQMNSVQDPEEKVSTFAYDGLGRERNRTLSNGNQINRTYDGDSNIKKIDNKQGNTTFASFAYTYDANGNRSNQVEEDGAETTFKYDELDRLIHVAYPIDKIRTLANQPDTPEDGDTPAASSEDGASITSTLLAAWDTVVSFFTAANSNGKGSDNDHGKGNGNDGNNGKTKENKKDANSCGPEEETEEDGTLVLDNLPDYLMDVSSFATYTYDAAGNRVAVTTDKGTETFTYNANNQVIAAGSSTFEYDDNGNLVTKTTNEGSIEFTYNGAYQLILSELEDGSFVNYAYDGLGRRAYREEVSWKGYGGITEDHDNVKTENPSKGKGNNGKAIGHEKDKASDTGQENRETTGSNGNNGKGKGNKCAPDENLKDFSGKGHAYGRDKNKGNRPKEDEPAFEENGNAHVYQKETVYMYEGLSTTTHKEYSPSGSPYAEYYNGPNGQLTSRKMFGLHGLASPTYDPDLKTTGGMLYYQYDGMRNTIGTTDRHGDRIENYRYDAFGGIYTGITSPYNHNGYTGMRYEGVTGLVDLNARWYDPTVGRFMSEDTYPGTTSNPQTLNRYAYTLNNPVNNWDPTGHMAELISTIPDFVRDERNATTLDPLPSGNMFKYSWNYQGKQVNKSEAVIVDEIREERGYRLKMQQNQTTLWYYQYQKQLMQQIDDDNYFPFGEPITGDETFRETIKLGWSDFIKAKDIAAGNLEKILTYGAPPDAKIVGRYVTLPARFNDYLQREIQRFEKGMLPVNNKKNQIITIQILWMKPFTVDLDPLYTDKEEHYSRNMHNDLGILDVTYITNNWKKASENLDDYHENTSPSNDKYWGPNGYNEVIINTDTNKIVTNVKDQGTYNFGKSDFGHFWYDMSPYWIWGNSPNDPTPIELRILGKKNVQKIQDIKEALERDAMEREEMKKGLHYN